MGAMPSQVTGVSIVYSTACTGTDQIKRQSPVSLAFVWGIHRLPVNSPHKGPVTRKRVPFDHVIMKILCVFRYNLQSISADEQPNVSWKGSTFWIMLLWRAIVIFAICFSKYAQLCDAIIVSHSVPKPRKVSCGLILTFMSFVFNSDFITPDFIS